MKYLILLLICLPNLAWSTPVKFASCKSEINFKEVKRGSGVLFDKNCEIGYVLPPREGYLEFLGLNPTGNLELVCGQYNDIEKAMKSITRQILLRTERIEKLLDRVVKYKSYLEDNMLPIDMTVEDVEEKIESLEDKADEQQEKYIKSWENLKGIKAFYAQTEGARGKYSMESHYNELVAEYQKKNPEIFFQKIPLEQSYLAINEKKRGEGDLSNMPMEAVISISSPGIKNLPLLKNVRNPVPEGELPPTDAPGNIFTDSLSGNIVLSALGACPLMDMGGLPSSINANDLKNDITANVIYQYHAQVQRKHTITYNLAQLAKRIETSSKRGGFFSRKNVNSLVENSESKKWITFKTYENDPSFAYTEEYKKEIKMQFLASVLKEVAYVSFDNSGKYPSVVEPTGKSGAGETADALGKCPHLYCQVGMFAMKILDSTFGSTTAISNYIKTRDVWSSETVDQQKMIPFAGSYTLK